MSIPKVSLGATIAIAVTGLFLTMLTTGALVSGDTSELNISIGLLFGSVVFIFFALIIRKWKISAGAGYFLIGIYVVYVIAELINVYFL